MPGLQPISLGVLPLQDSCELLAKITPRVAGWENEIAALCGYLPLALRVAASSLRERPDIAVPDYVGRLRDVKNRLNLVGVEPSINLSYELLRPALRQAWCSLAVFPSAFDLTAAAAVTGVDPDTARNILGVLLKHNIVEFVGSISLDGEAQSPVYRLHDLLRLFADSRLTQDARELVLRRYALHYANLLETLGSLYEAGGLSLQLGLDRFDFEWDNIEAAYDWASTRSENDTEAMQMVDVFTTLGIEYRHLRQSVESQIRWAESGLRASRATKNKQTEVFHLLDMGRFNQSYVGNFSSASSYYKAGLNLSRNEGCKWGEMEALLALGQLHLERGNVERAVAAFQQALQVAVDNEDRLGWEKCMYQLGHAYFAKRDFRSAHEFFEKCASAARERNASLTECDALLELATVHSPTEALGYYTEAHGTAKSLGYKLGEIRALRGIAEQHTELGNRREGKQCYEEALSLAVDEGYRLEEAVTLTRLAYWYARVRDWERAVVLYERALPVIREFKKLQLEAETLANLGMVCDTAGRPGAYKYLEESRAVYLRLSLPVPDPLTEALTILKGRETVERLAGRSGRVGRAALALGYRIRPTLTFVFRVLHLEKRWWRWNVKQASRFQENYPQHRTRSRRAPRSK